MDIRISVAFFMSTSRIEGRAQYPSLRIIEYWVVLSALAKIHEQRCSTHNGKQPNYKQPHGKAVAPGLSAAAGSCRFLAYRHCLSSIINIRVGGNLLALEYEGFIYHNGLPCTDLELNVNSTSTLPEAVLGVNTV